MGLELVISEVKMLIHAYIHVHVYTYSCRNIGLSD